MMPEKRTLKPNEIAILCNCPFCLEQYYMVFTILQMQRLIARKKTELKDLKRIRKDNR